MHKIHFKRVRGVNFKGYLDFDFNIEKGKYLVRGENNDDPGFMANGAGKTTIIDAILWAIRGQTIGGLDKVEEVVNNDASDGCYVELTMETNQGIFIITRSRNHSIHGSQIQLQLNDQVITQHKNTDNQSRINDMLGVRLDILRSVIMLDSNLSGRFTELTSSARVDVIESIRDYSIWNEARDLAGKSRDSLAKEISDQLGKINQHKSSILVYEETINSKNRAIEETKKDKPREIQASIDTGTRMLSEAEESLAKLKAFTPDESEKEVAERAIKNITEAAIPACDDLIESNQKKISGFEASRAVAKSEINNLTRQISAIKSGENCPTCGTKLQDVDHDHLDELERNIQGLESTVEYLNGEISKLVEGNDAVKSRKTTLKNRADEASSIIKSVERSVTDYNTQVSNLERNIEKYRGRLDVLRGQLEHIESTIKNLEADRDYAQEQSTSIKGEIAVIEEHISVLTLQRDVQAYWYDHLGPRGAFRPRLLKKDIAYINSRLSYYMGHIYSTLQARLSEPSTDDRTISILLHDSVKDRPKTLSMLSGGERKRLDLAIQFSIYDLICSTSKFHTNCLFLDEIFDSLDEIGLDKVLELLEDMSDRVESVYVISHNKHLKSQILQHVIAEKTNGVCTIRYEQ